MKNVRYSQSCSNYVERTVTSFLLISLLLIVTSCGFQLNRNKLQLLNQAQSISISEIVNKSFVPRLDINLKALLIETFNSNLVSIKPINQADLVLNLVINTYELKQSEYSLDETGQTYEFQFSLNGELSVFDNRTERYILRQEALKGSYSVTTQSADLSSSEVEEAREDLLEALSETIASKLGDDF